jgi:hypothetical protein
MEKEIDNKIVIKNYSPLFNIFMPLLVIALSVALYIIWKYLKILALEGGEIKYSFYASIVAVMFYVSHIFDTIKNFRKKPPVFTVDANQIIYNYYKTDYRHRRAIRRAIKEIAGIRHILHSEAPFQYGAINKKSLIGRFFKNDIGDNFLHLVAYLLGLTSLLLNLPTKTMLLLYNNEPLSLLRQNLLIEFEDGMAMIVNMYKMDDYKRIVQIFEANGKQIDNRLVLNIYLKEEE